MSLVRYMMTWLYSMSINIERAIKDFHIKLDEPLFCEIKPYKGIKEREAEIFALIRKGYNIVEISTKTALSQHLVKKFAKNILGKIISESSLK